MSSNHRHQVDTETDRITLTGLRAKGFHGVFDHERRDGQEFVLDIVLDADLRSAAASDDLRHTIDYGHLADGLVDIVRGEPCNLIETLAERLASFCLSDERVAAAEVTVHKPSAPIAHAFDDVAVTVRRHRRVSVGEPTRAVLALGANLGDRMGTLQEAVKDLHETRGIEVVGVSPVVETDPLGGPEQPDYLNAVVTIRTWLPPLRLLAECHRIEAEHGRDRGVRWGPRTLDIDVIVIGETVHSSAELEVPHPRAAQRAFVLVPWAALDPDAVIPGAGRVSVLATTAADADGVRPRPDLVLQLPT